VVSDWGRSSQPLGKERTNERKRERKETTKTQTLRKEYTLRAAVFLHSVHRLEFQITRKPNFSETGSVSVLRRVGETPILLSPLERANFKHSTIHKVVVEVKLRPTISRSVHLGVRHPSGTRQSQSHITTDNQSASPSWCQAPLWGPRPIFLSP
jgi:hypothetical protein